MNFVTHKYWIFDMKNWLGLVYIAIVGHTFEPLGPLRVKDDALYHQKDTNSLQLGANLLTFSFDHRT